MKKISYALFGEKEKTPENSFLYYAYMRGLVWNVKMNKLIYPDWISHVEVDVHTFSKYDNVFNALRIHYGMTININPAEPLCKAMLWRMKPIFEEGVEKVLCRDADAITTYREALMVEFWSDYGRGVLLIADNPAHQNMLMGGMCGFESAYFKRTFGWKTFEEMMSVANEDFNTHGTDQNFLAKNIMPSVIYDTQAFLPEYQSVMPGQLSMHIPAEAQLRNVNPVLWESNLTCRHIGSAGVVDLETIRFFKRFDNEIPEMKAMELCYPEIFYWHNK